MSIFDTKRKLRDRISDLEFELEEMIEMFPFKIGQTVYDVALKNDKGRYTKTKASLEHSTITEVVVDEKNYFSLVKRYRRNDVFTSREAAEGYLRAVCQ